MKRARLSRDALDTALLFTPGFVVYLGFMILPIVLCVYYAFFDWDGIRPAMHFVGLDNFVNAIKDRDFLKSLQVTAFFTLPGTIIVNALGILFANLVNRRGAMTNFYRSVFFFPLLISAVAVGFIWKALLSYDGVVNTMLAHIGVHAIDFIGSPKLAPWSMLFINVWHDTGFVTVLYLAGLQAIPTDLYDSARIDGASGWQQFARITFPWLAPAFTACVVFLFTGYMRMFDLVMVMTSGGPAGATLTVAYQVIFVGFSRNMLSYGSSLAIYMLVIISIVSVTLTYYLRKREEKLIM